MRIAHLAFDQKFIPLAQEAFEEAFPGDNAWYLLHADGQPFQFARPDPRGAVVDRRGLLSPEILNSLNRHPLLVVHAMIPEFAEVVRRVSRDPVVLWFGWGFEYYDFLEPYFGEIVLPDTAVAWRKARAAEERVGGFGRWLSPARRAYHALKGLVAGRRTTIQSIADRIDLCSVSPSEMPLLERAFPGFRARHYQLHYFSKEDTLDRGPARMEGPDILLGNSATGENNHVEALSLLRRMPLENRRILAPLNYGSALYADEICRLGTQLFGPRFVPLREFLPLDEYHELLATCGTVIMNHRRQAAMGNISAALYKGARVVLRAENPIFQTYRGLGAALDAMHDIEDTPAAALVPLSEAQRTRNRELVGNYLGRPALVEAIRGLEAFCRQRG
ncbi:MAG TPA: TDP-N-acetylfucosamine:lipid II N-acetylfucosaminyltransferase [Burkholderiales bacterium]|nr:TDP-N-acetylfucosamine:lipid II N-acetylfucosaminyltransferase [Burkholderiales bacterium]